MARGKPWTPSEDRTLMHNMNIYSFSEGRKRTSEELGRTLTACNERSYKLNKTIGFKWDKNNRISKESAKILKKEILKSPGNLKEAFRRTAIKTGLTYGSVSALYYGKETVMSRDNLGIVFMMIGKKITVNHKNYNIIKDNKITFKNIISFIKSLFE